MGTAGYGGLSLDNQDSAANWGHCSQHPSNPPDGVQSQQDQQWGSPKPPLRVLMVVPLSRKLSESMSNITRSTGRPVQAPHQKPHCIGGGRGGGGHSPRSHPASHHAHLTTQYGSLVPLRSMATNDMPSMTDTLTFLPTANPSSSMAGICNEYHKDPDAQIKTMGRQVSSLQGYLCDFR